MKKTFSIMTMALLVISIMPVVMAVSVGSGVTPDIVTEDFPPQIWMCDSRAVMDDNTEPGRVFGDPVFSEKKELCECVEQRCLTLCGSIATSYDFECNGLPCNIDFSRQVSSGLNCATFCEQETLKWSCPFVKGNKLIERHNNYAFEGEKIEWLVLVMDKNGVEKIEDVFATIGDVQGEGNDIEVNCARLPGYAAPGEQIRSSCNARIQEEYITQFDPDTMSYYECTFTVETPESMYGEFWITVEAIDLDGLSGTMDENEYWFLNPSIALSIDGDLTFEEVRPGTDAYSSTLLIGNDADDSSGVMMDMFISGTDFYDSSSSGAKCPYTNQLSLSAFRYFATSGAYSTAGDDEIDLPLPGVVRDRDAEGYVNIDYGIGFNNPNPFYDNMEIIQDNAAGGYYHANILAPGAEMALTFKLSLPEPCNGDFDTGSFYFWGEAI